MELMTNYNNHIFKLALNYLKNVKNVLILELELEL